MQPSFPLSCTAPRRSWETVHEMFRLRITPYYSVVKTLLGVRVTTADDLCLIELDIPSVVARESYPKEILE